MEEKFMDEKEIYEADNNSKETEDKANEIVEKIKELVKKGNVTYIRVRKDDRVIVNIPMTLGIVGTVLGAVAAPWALLVSTFATIGFDCTVEVEDKDGKVTVIHGKN